MSDGGRIRRILQRLRGEVFEAVAIRTLHSFVLAVIFGAGIMHASGRHSSLRFLYTYLWDCIMSLDNLYAMLGVFAYFEAQDHEVNDVLKWSLLTSVAVRFVLVHIGLAAAATLRTLVFPFAGLFCAYIGRLLYFLGKEKKVSGDRADLQSLELVANPVIADNTRHKDEDTITDEREGASSDRLLRVLILITMMDAVFSLDSIPDEWSIAEDEFSLYSSLMWGTITLRAMYSVFNHVVGRLPRMKTVIGVGLILTGCRLVVAAFWDIISSQVDFAASIATMILGLLFSVES